VNNSPSLRRERDLGGIIGDSFTLLFAHFGSFMGIVFPAAIASLASSFLVLAVEDELAATAVAVATGIVQFFVFEFVRSAGVVFLDKLDQQDRIPSAESLDRAQERLGIIGGAAIRSTAIVLAFSITIVGLPWAIMRIVRWAFLSQAIMLEDKRGEDVLATSAELVKDYWWSTAGRLLGSGLVIFLPYLLVATIADEASPIAGAFIEAALVFVSVPYGIISTTLMYFHLKARKARHDSFSPDRFAAP
jgi:hypothetical protein